MLPSLAPQKPQAEGILAYLLTCSLAYFLLTPPCSPPPTFVGAGSTSRGGNSDTRLLAYFYNAHEGLGYEAYRTQMIFFVATSFPAASLRR